MDSIINLLIDNDCSVLLKIFIANKMLYNMVGMHGMQNINETEDRLYYAILSTASWTLLVLKKFWLMYVEWLSVC